MHSERERERERKRERERDSSSATLAFFSQNYVGAAISLIDDDAEKSDRLTVR